MVKVESAYKITMFGLKIMVKSGLETISLKSLHVKDYFPLLHKRENFYPKFNNKNHILPT